VLFVKLGLSPNHLYLVNHTDKVWQNQTLLVKQHNKVIRVITNKGDKGLLGLGGYRVG